MSQEVVVGDAAGDERVGVHEEVAAIVENGEQRGGLGEVDEEAVRRQVVGNDMY